ncbi:MAG: malto-oligosyltrehalose synthase [Candidatus Sericytochromatia bacterium]
MSRVPVATYRLQLHGAFDFAAAREVVSYLASLGVTDVYTSPYLQAEAGSTHGYNVVSHAKINEELGGEEGHRAFTDALIKRGLGHVLDTVPNHMGIGTGENAWWTDVLENGPSSLYADFFDIEWHPPKTGLRARVLLPVLGDQYGNILERGELKLAREGGRFWVRYWEKRFPISPGSLNPLLERAAALSGLEEQDPFLTELQSIMSAVRHLPSSDETATAERLERAREKEVIKRRLEELAESSNAVGVALDAAVETFNGKPGDPNSFDDLDYLLQEQSYRLAFWRVATEEINYRRFFDINDLAAVRMEDPRVFAATHELIYRLIDEGRVTGLRLDHTDGLYDPLGYFRDLQVRRMQQLAKDEREVAGFAARLEAEWGSQVELPLYVVAEKILETGERLPRRWPIHGTTGYDFLALVNGLWVDSRAERLFTGIYRRFSGWKDSYADLVYHNKRLIMRTSLSSEINVLAQILERLAESNRRSRDFTLQSLTTAIVETIACFPVYRTYIREDGSREEHDDRYIELAIKEAKRRNAGINASIFHFLRDMLLLRFPDNATSDQIQAQIRFAVKFQQVTSPVMAKGVEDTTFYTYNRLTSLNEVGCDPAHFGVPTSEFHAMSRSRLEEWPEAMLSTSTHDTKRGEDVRARISVLSEMPDAWSQALTTWSRFSRTKRVEIDGAPSPSRNAEYLFYQNVLGAWPLDGDMEGFTERMQTYMTKATKEAKTRTSWVNPNPDYDEVVQKFVARMLADKRFLKSMGDFADRVAPYGAANGLGQVLLKLASPGVPDIYQGSELWNQGLVDPDNRRPVDYALRRRLLVEIERGLKADPLGLAKGLLDRFQDGAVKLLVTHVGLRDRQAHPALYLEGEYLPLEGGEHVVAFARRLDGRVRVAVAPRLSYKLTGGAQPWAIGEVWGEQTLTLPEPGRYRNMYTGEVLEGAERLLMREVLRHFPVALLERL